MQQLERHSELNRPESFNACPPLMAEQVRYAMHGAADDNDVRVIVLAGAKRAFCAAAHMADLVAAADRQGCSFHGKNKGF